MQRGNDPDRVAVVAVEESAQTGLYLIRLGRGRSALRLTGGTTYGPYEEDEIGPLFDEAVDSLRAEGFLPGGLHALLHDIQHSVGYARAKAAARLGWRRDPAAVEPLLAALPSAVDETCAILDALGAIGDKRAVPVLREYAKRKLLSRRQPSRAAALARA